MTLDDILTEDLIATLADPGSHERGENYFLEQRVGRLSVQPARISATVAGTATYRIDIWLADGSIGYACDCPIGVRGVFCKHCVATGLQWLTRDEDADRAGDTDTSRAWLERQDKNTLIELLADRAAVDDDLQDTLAIKAAADEFTPEAYKKLIRAAVGQARYVSCRDMPAYSRRIHAVIDGLEALLNGDAEESLIDLCEYALRRVETAAGRVDDSDGYMRPLLDRLQAIHIAACRVAKPDPIKLANRLFKWEMEGDWDTFFGAAETYAEVLGETGLAQYRKLAETEWARVTPLVPGDHDAERYGRRFAITSIMESLAHVDGDLEQWISVKARDLSSAYAFVQIAGACLEAGEVPRALEWAQKGVAAFGETADHRLAELLADIHHADGDHRKAVELQWRLYAHDPNLSTYTKLRQSADRLQAWPDWRQRALTCMRDTIDRARRDLETGALRYSPWSDNSLLIEILLSENAVDTAWQEARAGGCDSALWRRLAKLRGQQHPRDAIDVYRLLIPDIVNRTNNTAYAEAMKLVARIAALQRGLGEQQAFADYLATLRVEFKRKRNFMRMLDTLSSPIAVEDRG